MPFIGATGGFGYGRWQQYNSMGITQWATYIQANNYPNPYNNIFYHQAVCCDTNNNILYTFLYDSSASTNLVHVSTIGQSTTNYTLFPTYDTIQSSGIGIAKYNSNGNIQWVTGMNRQNNSNSNFSESIVTDSQDNIYITGYFLSTLTIYNTSGFGQVDSGLTLSSLAFNASISASNHVNCYLVKYNSNGNLQWVTMIDGSVGPCLGSGLTIDNNDNIYVTGQYSGNAPIIYDASGLIYKQSAITLLSGSGVNVFIVKYNSSGKSQWGNIIATANINEYTPRICYNNNQLYLAGFLNNIGNTTISFNLYDVSGNTQKQSPVSLVSSSSNAAYLIKYNTNGIVQWATYNDGLNHEHSYDVTADSYGNVYWCGITGQNSISNTDTIVFKDVSGNTQTDSSVSTLKTPCSFLAKYNSNGKIQWATGLSSITTNATTTPPFNKLFCDKLNNIYVTGSYTDTKNSRLMLNNALNYSQTTSLVSLDGNPNRIFGFLINYNTNGTVVWATTVGPSGTSTQFRGLNVTCDNQNNIYMSGYYSNSVTSATRFYLRDYSNYVQTSSIISLPGTASKNYNFLIKYR